MLKYLLPYDVYERHRKVGEHVKNHTKVLDVGGELNHLSQFCRPSQIVVANLQGGDVIISKDKLPFPKDSFDIVCSIDVLEHMPKQKRAGFIENLLKIASKKVILSFPLGTKKHKEYEDEIANWLKETNKNVAYLKEHIKYGLPTHEDVSKLTKNLKSEIFYSGNISISKILFKIFLFDPKIKVIRKFIYFAKLLFNLITNPIFYLILINKPYSQSVNRIYVVIYKN